MADVVQKKFGKGDFFTLTPYDDEGYYATTPQEKKCCGRHRNCKCVPDTRRINIIKGGKK